MHFVHCTLLVKRTLPLPYFLPYVDFKSAEKVRSLPTCFTTHMLQNKELKKCHLKIGFTDRTFYHFQMVYPVTIVLP